MYKISIEIERFKNIFESTHPSSKLDQKDWLRCSYAQRFLVGRSMVEVGPGVGMMLHAATSTMDKITALDIKKHSQAMFPSGVKFVQGSISDKELVMDSHDTVVCMEVLEHIPPSFNGVIFNNLRKISRQRIILSVPLNEPEPLWGHNIPGGHRQRFTVDKLSSLFPNSYATILPRYGVEWAFVIEDRQRQASYFQIVSRDQLITIFS